MPKKTAKRRRTRTSSRSASGFSKFLTFPVIAVVFFVVLSLVTLFLVMQPNSGVLGVTDSGSAPFIK